MDVILGEARLEQAIGHQREAVLDRRVRQLAEIGREHVVPGRGRADRVEGLLPRDLSAVDRREAALEQRAPLGELALLVDGNALRRIVRMRHDDVGDSRGERRVDRGVDLGSAQMPRREHDVVAGDDLEHSSEPLLGQLHRRARDPGRRELVLDLAPDRLLGGLGPIFTRLVLGVDGRQPDDPRAFARRDLDRQRVQPADAGVQRDRAERIDARHRRAHDGRSLGRGHVVRLEHEARQAELGEAPREPEVVDPPLRQIRLDVDVQVVGPAHELSCAGGGLCRLSGSFGQEARPPRVPEVSP